MIKGDNQKTFNFGFWQICRLYSNIWTPGKLFLQFGVDFIYLKENIKTLNFLRLHSDLLTISSCKIPIQKHFLDLKFLFVNRFSKFLQHILGLKEC